MTSEEPLQSIYSLLYFVRLEMITSHQIMMNKTIFYGCRFWHTWLRIWI